MYRVLVPVDDNEDRARRQASFVAGLPNADEAVEAYLLFVFTDGAGATEMPTELQRFNSAERVASVRRAEECLEDAGVDYQLLEDSGEVADDIIQDAEDLDVDLIVLGGSKRSPAGKLLFGSVTQEVLLNTDRPATVTGGGG
ncbi:nucleotide-binding universal stress UspA family protein [Halohasta litchfieldiae]|jgi:nucleotide-binding universal stress UspA family protein|uniref:Nucleotide-binding universal stress protein, UspA family n=1 Tax=Halohasta litchfieldiae TaxID=1073996 RepID=A0A1H6WSR4_9EURY|nr:universal stress protein [Halohasta litchfieldiae]ATW89190.1 nucleotide-binding universal stress UspA family protein [Halohasta litchfieldiae]SEJ19878.1 Nucleotide-binding universal stress protein, UspA family [Halohasta litchfieldiae]